MVSKGKEEESLAREWIIRIRKGNDDCFELLFRCYYERLTRFAWRYVRSVAIAEELVQDLFARLWEDRRSLEVDGSVQSYLYASVRNRCLNLIKHEKVKQKYHQRWKEEMVPDPRNEPVMTPLDREREGRLNRALQRAIDALPDKQRMTYLLSRKDGLTYPEIARIKGISVKAVEKRMTAALNSLREELSHLL